MPSGGVMRGGRQKRLSNLRSSPDCARPCRQTTIDAGSVFRSRCHVKQVKNDLPPIPPEGTVPVTSASVDAKAVTQRSIATRNRDLIRKWADRHQAEPATGQASASGPATLNVNDGDSGVRFNFPGLQRFRPISWDEWFDHFDAHSLVFVYEEEVADRAYQLWEVRGHDHGHDREDWFNAERQMDATGKGRSSAGYRIVRVG
jgi:hypothetical protein